MTKWRSFTQARKFARSLKLKTQQEWNDWCGSGKRPDDIPRNPVRIYKKEWKGVPDWLGTGRTSNKEKHQKQPNYDDASKICHDLGIKLGTEYFNKYKKKKLPKFFPANPPNVYHKIWKKRGGWGGFLQTGDVANQDRKFLDYNDAKKIVQKSRWKNKKISSGTEYEKWSLTNQRPRNIPANPERTYNKEKTWISWGDYLGTEIIANKDKQFRGFKEARKFVQKLKLNGQKEWYKYSKSGNLPADIPTAPWNQYKNKGWTSLGDFLGTGTIASQYVRQHMLSYEDAEIAAHRICAELKIDDAVQWRKAYDEGKIPKNLPRWPESFYSESNITGRKKKK